MSAEHETVPDAAGEITSHLPAPRLGLTALACAARIREEAARHHPATAAVTFLAAARLCEELLPAEESQPVSTLVTAFCAGDTGSLFVLLDWLQDRAASGDRERAVQLSKVLAAVGRLRAELKTVTRPRSALYCFGRLERRLCEVFWQDMVNWPEAMREMATARRLANRKPQPRPAPGVTAAGDFVPGDDEPGDDDADDLFEDTDPADDDAELAAEHPTAAPESAVEVDFDSGSFVALQQAVTEHFGRAMGAEIDRQMDELTAKIVGGDGSPGPAGVLALGPITREQRVSALVGEGPQWQLTAHGAPGHPDRFTHHLIRPPAGRVWLFVESADRKLCYGWHAHPETLASAMTRDGVWGHLAPLGELYIVTGEGRLLPV